MNHQSKDHMKAIFYELLYTVQEDTLEDILEDTLDKIEEPAVVGSYLFDFRGHFFSLLRLKFYSIYLKQNYI